MKIKSLIAVAFGAAVMTMSWPAGAQEEREPQRFETEDGFVWYKSRVNGCIQIMDKDKNVIIPASRGYRQGRYKSEWGRFTVSVSAGTKNPDGVPESYHGICLEDGTEVISPKRRYTYCLYNRGSGRYTVKKGTSVGVCDSTGRELISPDLGYESCRKSRKFYIVASADGRAGLHDYETGRLLIPVSRGYVSVSYNPVRDFVAVKRDGLCGICSNDGTEIIPPVWYDCIYNTAVQKFKGRRTKDTMWEDIDMNNPVPHD